MAAREAIHPLPESTESSSLHDDSRRHEHRLTTPQHSSEEVMMLHIFHTVLPPRCLALLHEPSPFLLGHSLVDRLGRLPSGPPTTPLRGGWAARPVSSDGACCDCWHQDHHTPRPRHRCCATGPHPAETGARPSPAVPGAGAVGARPIDPPPRWVAIDQPPRVRDAAAGGLSAPPVVALLQRRRATRPHPEATVDWMRLRCGVVSFMYTKRPTGGAAVRLAADGAPRRPRALVLLDGPLARDGPGHGRRGTPQ